jgi:hypothetical protein
MAAVYAVCYDPTINNKARDALWNAEAAGYSRFPIRPPVLVNALHGPSNQQP